MSLDSKVVWGEGMFLNPQHFQQQERYFERFVDAKFAAVSSYLWGIQSLEIDQQLLKLGKLSVIRGVGLFPDGTPFNFPDVDNPPPVVEYNQAIHEEILFLAVPVKRAGAVDVVEDVTSEGLARFYSSNQSVRDTTLEGSESVSLNVAKPRLRILRETDDLSGYACIGVLKIKECGEDRNIVLDDSYVPTCLDCNAAARLKSFLNELTGLLHHRAEAIAGRLADSRRGGTAEIADYLLLQLLNRLEPLASYLSRVETLHPLELYKELTKMVGELSTFFSKTKRAPEMPLYRHHNLQGSLMPVIASLRQCLSMVYEQTAIALEIVEKKFGIRVIQIPDRSMVDSAVFVLAAKADVSDEMLRNNLPKHIKIASVERIRQLVNAQLPGIPLKPLPVSPRQVPFRTGYHYFELEKHSELWKELNTSGGIAMHLGGDFPGLQMEFWVIRQ